MEKIRSPQELEKALIGKYKLLSGEHVSFEKISVHGTSSVPIGSKIEGELAGTVRRGEPITFRNSSAAISDIQKISERDDVLFIETTTSIYRLNRESQNISSEEFELQDVFEVETARGSIYRYLSNGTTQRYKKVENKEYEPQSALVYVPDYEWVKQHAPANVIAKLGENEVIYTDILLEYVHSKDKKVYIVDKGGNKLQTNEEIESVTGPVSLAFLTGQAVDFTIPISHKPKVGFSTYDTRLYNDPVTGERMREGHLGNKVVRISLRK